MWTYIVYTHTIITLFNTLYIYIYTQIIWISMYTVYALCILTFYISCIVHILSAQIAKGLFVL